MYFLKHSDEQSTVSELPEYIDAVCDGESNSLEDQPPADNAATTEAMPDWFASDEAGFWMSQ